MTISVEPGHEPMTGGQTDVAYFGPQAPLEHDGTVPDRFSAQFRRSLELLAQQLSAANLDLDNALRAEIHVVDGGACVYDQLQTEFLSGFPTEPRPARCVSAVSDLCHGELVRIGCIAATDRKPDPAGAVIAPDGPAPCAPFPHARRHGKGVWATAQVGSDPASGSLAPVPGGSLAQLRYAISNLEAILLASGVGMGDVRHARLQYTESDDHLVLAEAIKESGLPEGAVDITHVPFIPTAQSGVSVKIDAVAVSDY